MLVGYRSRDSSGFTLVEILAVILILGILMSIALPRLFQALQTTRNGRAIADLHTLQQQIEIYRSLNAKIPDSWNNLGAGAMPRDPWGRSYVYTSHLIVLPILFRTNGILIPINTDYDLYSMGPDGQSLLNILDLLSKDDIIRADDGAFFGVAVDY